MSNYTKENLIAIPPTAVPAGTLAMKVGDEIFTPGNIKIGQSMDFYKCTSVDTTSKTWTGYLAVLTDGVYTFEKTATTGLTYGEGFTPVVNGIYDDRCLIKVNELFGGTAPTLIFYDPLRQGKATAETGQAITYSNCSFVNYKGISCMRCDNGTSYAVSQIPDIPQGASKRTISFWGHADNYTSDWMAFLSYGTDTTSQFCAVRTNQNCASLGFSYNDHNSDVVVSEAWHHFALTYTGTHAVLYVDGTVVLNVETNLNTTGTSLKIGAGVSDVTSYRGYIAAVRIYNRVLSNDEISALASEFTPTA